MAPSIIGKDAIQGEIFFPGQILVFGGFVLRANSLGHLEPIDSYAPGHQVRFGSLNYTTHIRGELIFDGFELMSGAPHSHDEHDLALPSDGVREITRVATPALNLEQMAPSEDGWMDPSTEAAHSAGLEPNTDFASNEACVIGPSDSSPVIDSQPRAFVPIESDWAPIMEFTSADIFQHSPLGDVLNSLLAELCPA